MKATVASVLVLLTLVSSRPFDDEDADKGNMDNKLSVPLNVFSPRGKAFSPVDNEATELALEFHAMMTQETTFFHHETALPRPVAGHTPCEDLEVAGGDATINCITYPSKTVCNHSCGFGYTHEKGGLYKEFICNNDGRWIPEYEHCKPFIDCSLYLIAGSYKCTQKELNEGPICHVICNTTDGINLPTEQTTSCNIYGEWEPDLPWCAVPGGRKLVSPPHGYQRVIEF